MAVRIIESKDMRKLFKYSNNDGIEVYLNADRNAVYIVDILLDNKGEHDNNWIEIVKFSDNKLSISSGCPGYEAFRTKVSIDNLRKFLNKLVYTDPDSESLYSVFYKDDVDEIYDSVCDYAISLVKDLSLAEDKFSCYKLLKDKYGFSTDGKTSGKRAVIKYGRMILKDGVTFVCEIEGNDAYFYTEHNFKKYKDIADDLNKLGYDCNYFKNGVVHPYT